MLSIIPAILTSDESELKDLLSKCEGVAESVQIDIIDGIFADNKTIDPSALEKIQTNLEIDYQLMVKEPIEWIDKCIRGQARAVIGHVEMMKSQEEFVDRGLEAGLEVGLGLDLKTPVNAIDEEILMKLDVILVMSVKAGFGGQEFKEEAIEKIKRLSELREKESFKYRICVDGGITLENIKSVAEAGADEVCVGRRLFKGDLADNIDRYLQAASEIDLISN